MGQSLKRRMAKLGRRYTILSNGFTFAFRQSIRLVIQQRKVHRLQHMFRKLNRPRHVKTLNEENQFERLSQSVTPLCGIPYQEQLQLKQELMCQCLTRVTRMVMENHQGEVAARLVEAASDHQGMCCPLENIKPSPLIHEFRNKDGFSVGCDILGNEKTVGHFVGKLKHNNLVCVEPDRLINVPRRHKEICKAFQDFIRRSPLPGCQVLSSEGFWRALTIRSTRFGQSMVVVMANSKDIPQSAVEEAQNDVLDYFTHGPGKGLHITSLHFRVSEETSDRRSSSNKLLYGEPHLVEMLNGMKFRISPESFFQTNTAAAEVLYSTVKDYANLTEDTTVLDVYCGTGTIGLLLSDGARSVIGIERIEEAVNDARINAWSNDCDNVEFLHGDAHKVMNVLFQERDFEAKDVVAVVNPGRIGITKKAVRALRRCPAIKRLVYITCKPHGNVLQNFVDLSVDDVPGLPFVPDRAVAVDMFPHTLHTELLVRFQR